jgi:hypothetical protein
MVTLLRKALLRPQRSLRLHRQCMRLQSTSPGKGSFPLDLPPNFQFASHSIVYSSGHQTIPSPTPSSTIPILNPATEETLLSIDIASPETVEASITDAHEVFISGKWSRADPTDRFHVMNRIARLLRTHGETLANRTFISEVNGS